MTRSCTSEVECRILSTNLRSGGTGVRLVVFPSSHTSRRQETQWCWWTVNVLKGILNRYTGVDWSSLRPRIKSVHGSIFSVQYIISYYFFFFFAQNSLLVVRDDVRVRSTYWNDSDKEVDTYVLKIGVSELTPTPTGLTSSRNPVYHGLSPWNKKIIHSKTLCFMSKLILGPSSHLQVYDSWLSPFLHKNLPYLYLIFIRDSSILVWCPLHSSSLSLLSWFQ